MFDFLATQLNLLLVEMYRLIPNLGLVIIIFTLIVRFIIFAFTYKSLKKNQTQQVKMKEMNAELEKLKEKYKDDPEVFKVKQLELTKKYNLNPFAGCIPQILQILLLIVFYQAIIKLVGTTEVDGAIINAQFLAWNLVEKDPWYVLPILAGALQFLLSFMVSPGAQTRDLVSNNKNAKKEIKEANKAEEDSAKMAATMQRQMMFMMPVMTAVIAISLPAGVVLYWITSTIFSIGQQVALSGWGRLAFWNKKDKKEKELDANKKRKH